MESQRLLSKGPSMNDVLMIAMVVVCFGLCFALVWACERL